jgi:transcriptional regulator with XRE-family HTH domain
MIKNDKQYQVTKNRLKEFRSILDELENGNDNLDPIYKSIENNAVQSQINQFEQEIGEYEFLKQGHVNHVFVDSLSSLYEALIKTRIIRGWTQADLAKHLELKEQQIQRYELCNYSTASIARINQVASTLGLDIKRIKIEVSQPIFNLPDGLDTEMILNGFNKIKDNGTLLPV